MIRSIFISFMLLMCFTAPQLSLAQCPQVLGSAGEITSNPVWYNCTDGLNILAIETASSWNNLVVDWGDGSPIQTIGAFESGDSTLAHPYVAGNPYYEVTLSEADGSCILEGLYYAGAPVSGFLEQLKRHLSGNGCSVSPRNERTWYSIQVEFRCESCISVHSDRQCEFYIPEPWSV